MSQLSEIKAPVEMRSSAPTAAPGGIAPLKNVAALMTLAQRVINRPRHLSGIAMFEGFSGYGKTKASIWVQNKTGALRLEVQPWWRTKAFAAHLLRELGVANPRGSISDMIEEALLYLSQPGHPPLIIDEADRAVKNGFIESIRMIHEASKAPVILIGEEKFGQALKAASERTHMRVLAKALAEPCDAGDARALADTWLPAGFSIDAGALERVRVASGGRHRLICNNFDRMVEWGRLRGVKELRLFDGALDDGEPLSRAKEQQAVAARRGAR